MFVAFTSGGITVRIFQSGTEQAGPVQISVGDKGRSPIAAFVREAFQSAGIEINGGRPYDLRVIDPRLIGEAFLGNSQPGAAQVALAFLSCVVSP